MHRKSNLLLLVIVAILLTAWVGRTLYSQSSSFIGYAVLTPDAGRPQPVGSALFTFSNEAGVLVSQAGVGATVPIKSGRIIIDEVGTKTAIALVNPSSVTANATLILRDSGGTEVKRAPQTLTPKQHIARYVREVFPDTPASFTGSLSFDSDQALAALALREARNGYDEPLYATLPVIDLAAATTSDSFTFPQIAVGGGFTTQLILINRSSQTARGQIQLTTSAGAPLLVRLSGTTVSSVAYDIAPQGMFKATLDGVSGVDVGYAVVTPNSGTVAPSGTAIFRFQNGAGLVSEAGVPAAPMTTAARIFVDQIGTRTGVAIANPGTQTANLKLTLLDRYGGSLSTVTRRLSPRTHVPLFADELFSGVSDGFSGIAEISSDVPVAPITLKITVNARNEQVLTTFPILDLTRPPTSTAPIIFPQIAIGFGFSTRFILINSSTTNTATGSLSFYVEDGTAWTVPMGGQAGSQFPYQMTSGGGHQYLPGNTAQVAAVQVIDPSTSKPTSEITINQGNTVRPQMRMVDNTGSVRDDFDPTFTSIDPSVVTVIPDGSLVGTRAGFSTLTVRVGGYVTNVTGTVVRVDSAIGGFNTTGVVQDLARRLYVAATDEQTILLAQSLTATPDIYAGTSHISGLKNDVRLQSQFRNPAFLALNQFNGTLFVSDSANNVIRRVQPGTTGRVETFAGTGSVGNTDGTLSQATFNNPQGIALDNSGNLWVVDSGNHTIRRISLVSGRVETIAGKAGSPGLADGTGTAAQFRAPVGIAFETESTAQQLEREKRGESAPPVSVIVADTGNGVLRRVKDTGVVETISESAQSVAALAASTDSATSLPATTNPLAFSAPTGVAVDPLGNIYVTEPSSRQVKVVLQNRAVVGGVQSSSFTNPKGIVIAQTGRVVVADNARSAQEISYGEPFISAVTPDHVSFRGGDEVTIQGSNFAPDSVVIVGNTVISNATLRDTRTITFIAPPLDSGLTTLSVQNRAGVAQKSLLVDSILLDSLQVGYITTIAGGSTFKNDGVQAQSATLQLPWATTLDQQGNILIADQFNNRIRKVAATTGIVTSVAGNGVGTFSGDGGPAIAASLSSPYAIAVDVAGNLFIADTSNDRIRKVTPTGTITTVAGGSTNSAVLGDGGLATAANLFAPQGVAVNSAGDVFIADTGHSRIRKVAAATGIITTVAGNGNATFSGDGGSALAASLSEPSAIVFDSAGNLFIADTGNQRIRKIAADTNVTTTVAGNGTFGFSGDNGPAQFAQLFNPVGIAVDTAGNVFIADGNNRIRRVDAGTNIITTVVGNGQTGFSGDGGSALNAMLSFPTGVAVDAAGNLLVTDTQNQRIRKVAAQTGIITTIAGGASFPETGPASAATIQARAITTDASGNLFIADEKNNRLRKVNLKTGTITTIAGKGPYGFGSLGSFSGDGGLATNADLFFPTGVAVDTAGNVFIADSWNHRIRKVDAKTNVITTIAGNSIPGLSAGGFSGDNGPATSAALSYPQGVAVDVAGNVFIADSNNARIRRIDAKTSIITTIAGNGTSTFTGDNVLATSTGLTVNFGITVDPQGNIVFADTNNLRIRKINVTTRIITTLAGNGQFSPSGNNVSATSVGIFPNGVAVDASGNLYLSDATYTLSYVRRVDATTGIIKTIAGGATGFSGDNGPAINARVGPANVAVDSFGNVFFVDYFLESNSYRVRAIRGPVN